MSDQWEGIERQLRAVAPNMSPALARTTMWLADHLPEVAWRTVEEIAAAARVSPASVVRCLQQAGYQGYNAFRRVVQQGLPASELVWELTRGSTDSSSSVVTQVIQQEHENLARLEALTKPVIMELVQDLLHSRTTVFTGSITSAPLADYAATELNILLGNVRFFDSANSAAWLYVRDSTPEDVIIGISFPRYAQSTLELLRTFKPKVRRVWLLTDEIGPRNVKDLGHLVRLPVTAHGSFRSRASVASLVQILAVLLAETSPQTILAKVDEADEAWREARFVTMYTAQADRPARRKR